jgi:hypothetical protein
MSSEDTEHKDLFKRNLSHGSLAALAAQDDVEVDAVRCSGRQPCSRPRHPAVPFSISQTATCAFACCLVANASSWS